MGSINLKEMKQFVRRILSTPLGLRVYWRHLKKSYVDVRCREKYGKMGRNIMLEPPIYFSNQSSVFLDDHVKIRQGFQLINNSGKFIVGEYSAIAMNCMVVTGNHRPTVGVPHTILGAYHINDKETDVVVNEEVWIGVNCTLLPGTVIGRGAIIGGCSMVNKEIPPYAVAVGAPARVIASVFTIDEILEHERKIYPPEKRLTKEYLEELFATHFVGKKSIGMSEMGDADKAIVEEQMAILGIRFDR